MLLLVDDRGYAVQAYTLASLTDRVAATQLLLQLPASVPGRPADEVLGQAQVEFLAFRFHVAQT